MKVECKKCKKILKIPSKSKLLDEKINILTFHIADCGLPRECFPHLIKKKEKVKKNNYIDHQILDIIHNTENLNLDDSLQDVNDITKNIQTITI
jgi:hypothetical protein